MSELPEYLRTADNPPGAGERAAVLNLVRATGLGARRVASLLEIFGSARAAASADETTLHQVGGLSREAIESLREAAGEGFGELELERAASLGARIVLPRDPDYPDLLRRIHAPPMALYMLGENPPKEDRAVAVVGSRAATEAGTEVAHQIGAGLSMAGVHVVSGMAHGIDGAAHRGALQEGGNTVAVLGSGVDVVYPREHRGLYDEIVRDGCVVSELFLSAGPEKRNFPMRNRIIAGMSAATVVAEAAEKSGSLITASLALDENRTVLAVPGHPLSKKHAGCNYLIRQGASMVRHAADVLEDLAPELGLTLGRGAQAGLDLGGDTEGLGDEEKRVLAVLDRVEPVHADIIADRVRIDTSRLGVLLMQLEMAGYVQRIPGERYRLLARR
jgi:DNA processing protein